MRYFLRDGGTAEKLADELVDAAYSVVEGSIPENRVGDIHVGLYVAVRQVLASCMVRRELCGTRDVCDGDPVETPFIVQAPDAAPQ